MGYIIRQIEIIRKTEYNSRPEHQLWTPAQHQAASLTSEDPTHHTRDTRSWESVESPRRPLSGPWGISFSRKFSGESLFDLELFYLDHLNAWLIRFFIARLIILQGDCHDRACDYCRFELTYSTIVYAY